MSEYNGVLYGADPPAGIERNPDQSPDAAVLTVVTGIVFPLAAISMFIRMYARVVIIKKVALDDCKLNSTVLDYQRLTQCHRSHDISVHM